ncbi:MAG: type II/IV secretion system ATPase subunit [Halanaeroarchaeum sp.]
MSRDPDAYDPSVDFIDEEVRSEDVDPTVRDDAGPTFSRVARSVIRTVQMLRGSTVDVDPFVPERDGPLVSEDLPADEDPVDRYWVNAPFAYVAITRNEEENEFRYRTVEPALSDAEYALLQMLFEDVRDPLVYGGEVDESDTETVLQEATRDHLERYGARIDMQGFYKLFYYLYRAFQGYGRLDPIMHDPHVEDVSCDGYDLPIFVYHDEYTDVQTDVSFGEDDLDNFVIRLAQQSGRHISIGDPMAETTLPDGSRAQLSLGKEVTPRGSAFTIRKYSDEPFTPVDLLNYGTFNVDQMAFLWLAIEHNKSLIFAGGTASGKTTSMNAISMFIPPRSKVLSIEDTRELSLYHDNWLSSVTRERLHEGTDVTMYDLLRAALRHRPEYIIVGEVRGEEAITLFQAMNTGHTTYSTMHADSVRTVINRLENEPINVPRPMVASLDILLVQTLTRLEGERVRRNKTIAEIEGIDQRTGELDYSTSFTWDAEDDTFASSGSIVLDEIRDDQAWSQSELLGELRNRRQFLRYLRDREVTDYRRFTAMINEYYTDPDRAMDLIEDGSTDALGSITTDSA